MRSAHAASSATKESFHFAALNLKTLLAPELVQVNRLPARSTFTHFPDSESVRTQEREQSQWFQSLDGIWDAHLARCPQEALRFLEQTEEVRKWEVIKVPGHWQLQGFWDRPHCTNVEMPFDLEPPLVRKKIRRAFIGGVSDCRVGGRDNGSCSTSVAPTTPCWCT